MKLLLHHLATDSHFLIPIYLPLLVVDLRHFNENSQIKILDLQFQRFTQSGYKKNRDEKILMLCKKLNSSVTLSKIWLLKYDEKGKQKYEVFIQIFVYIFYTFF